MTQFPGGTVIPQKFVDVSGNVNVAALAQGLQHLGGDPCVIRSRHPHGVGTQHALPADENVLKSIAQGVTHMQ